MSQLNRLDQHGHHESYRWCPCGSCSRRRMRTRGPLPDWDSTSSPPRSLSLRPPRLLHDAGHAGHTPVRLETEGDEGRKRLSAKFSLQDQLPSGLFWLPSELAVVRECLALIGTGLQKPINDAMGIVRDVQIVVWIAV